MATVDVFGRQVKTPPGEVDFQKDVLAFGRPGCGAPIRTKSGRPLTFLKQDPIIRYNSKAENSFLERYERKIREMRQPTSMTPPRISDASNSRAEYIPAYEVYESRPSTTATEIVQSTRNLDLNRNTNSNNNYEGYEREKSHTLPRVERKNSNNSNGPISPVYITHRPDLNEKLGWVNSSSPSVAGIANYRQALQEQLRVFAERKRRDDQEYRFSAGNDLVSLLCQKKVGKPKRDPITGDIINHHLGTTDVTSVWRRPLVVPPTGEGYEFLRQDPVAYRNFLAQQQANRLAEEKRRHQQEQEIYKQHCKTWSSFWGRPGYGAPLPSSTHKGNLYAMLHHGKRYKSPLVDVPVPPRSAPNPKLEPLDPLIDPRTPRQPTA
ncbi:unnamed protein product [Notodromas monacha]|uniref:Uncharacterized protein n=1 Tax=Notodromas monacha TaxID=399045 RepID=A0A7R9GFL0_9CRUS|nr:unnamed protein product [Notodromas monacha]CAG0918985.1 unnamed protein product [Notodromas monacha]